MRRVMGVALLLCCAREAPKRDVPEVAKAVTPDASRPDAAPPDAAPPDAAPPDAAPARAKTKQKHTALEKQLGEMLKGIPSYHPPEAWTRCASDDECIVTGTLCGNESFPINKQHAAEAKAEVAKLCKRYPQMGLLGLMPKPRCKDGHCIDAAYQQLGL
jgi:hypothetical protein